MNLNVFVHVAVMSAPLHQFYTYRWCFSEIKVQKGLRVLVSFGRTRRIALVLGVSSQCDLAAIKDVLDVLDEEPLYTSRWWPFFSRMQHYYLASHAVLFSSVFAWAKQDEQCQFHCENLAALTAFDQALATLFKSRKTRQMQGICKNIDAAWVRVRRACQAGVLTQVQPTLTPHTGTASNISLRPAQQLALDAVLHCEGFSPILLFGVTGSGKTEVYLRALAHHVAQGKQVLVLVPEIGLIPQWLRCLEQHCSFVGQWHSGMRGKQRLAVRLNLGRLDVLIGTRSALFLPLPRLALIVVDEEHDTSFKQQETLRYSARDMAVLLAQTFQLPIILGSATPSLESWHKAKQGQYQLLRLEERISEQRVSQPEIIDLRHTSEPLSSRLMQALAQTKEKQAQSILFLNRRGYAPSLYCCACAHIVQCHWCSGSLTLHLKQKQLRCHRCGYANPVPMCCPECQSESLKPLGVGTERVVEQLKESLPDLRVELLDRDRVSSTEVLSDLLQAFRQGDIDCLVGTQMLVKGHHFPNVTLIGVVHADLGLNMPDFRATERWWQQLTQVLGRTGRGDQAGRVLIQTLEPDGQWLHRLGDQHAQQVLDEELALRKQFSYPPFSRWVRIVFSAIFANDALQEAHACVQYLRAQQAWSIDVLDPMPCVLERKAGRFRYEVVLRDPSRQYLPWCLSQLEKTLPMPAKVRRVIDVDPCDMM